MESVPEKHFTDIRITPGEDRQVTLQLPDPQEGDAWAVFSEGKLLLNGVFDEKGQAVFTLKDGILWTPETHPHAGHAGDRRRREAHRPCGHHGRPEQRDHRRHHRRGLRVRQFQRSQRSVT